MSTKPILDDEPSIKRYPKGRAPVDRVPAGSTRDTLARRVVRRAQLRRIVPLADTTIYELEQRGEFPRRFYLTSRCVVWDLAEVEAWIEERRRKSAERVMRRAPHPDVRLRKNRPVHSMSSTASSAGK